MATMDHELWNENGQHAEILTEHDEFESREFLEDSFFANVESWDDFDARAMLDRSGLGNPMDTNDMKSISEIHSQPIESLGVEADPELASESDNNCTSDQDTHQRHSSSLTGNLDSQDMEFFRSADDGSLQPESDTDSGMLLSRRDSTMSFTTTETLDRERVHSSSSIYAEILTDGSINAPPGTTPQPNYLNSAPVSHKRQASVAAQPLVGGSNFDSPDFTGPSASSLECDRAENYLAMLVKQRNSKGSKEYTAKQPVPILPKQPTPVIDDSSARPRLSSKSTGVSIRKDSKSGKPASQDDHDTKPPVRQKSKDGKEQPPVKTNLRKRMSKEQSQMLEESFQQVSRPSLEERDHLVAVTGLPMRTIQIWFQNRRAKTRAQSNSTSSHDVASCFIDPSDAAAAALPMDHWAVAGVYAQNTPRIPQYPPSQGPHQDSQQPPGGPMSLSMAQPAPIPQAPLGMAPVPHPHRPRPVSVQQPVFTHRPLTSPQIGTTLFRGSPERIDMVPESPLFGDQTPHLGGAGNPFASSIETSPLALRSPAMDAFTMPSPIAPSPLPNSGPWTRPTPRRSPSRHRMSPVRHHSISGPSNSGLLQSPNIGPSYSGYGYGPNAAGGPTQMQAPNWSRPSYLSRSKSAVVLTDQYAHKDFDYEVKRRKDNSGRSTPASRMSPAATPPVSTGGFHMHMGSYDNLSSLPSRNSRSRQRSYTQPTMRYDPASSGPNSVGGSNSASSSNMRLQLDDSGDKARLVWVPVASGSGGSMASKSVAEESEAQYLDFESASRRGRTHQSTNHYPATGHHSATNHHAVSAGSSAHAPVHPGPPAGHAGPQGPPGPSGPPHGHPAGYPSGYPAVHPGGHPAGHGYDSSVAGQSQQSQQFQHPWQSHPLDKTPTRRPASVAAPMSFGHQRSSSGHSFTGNVITPAYAGVGGQISAAFGLTGPNSAPPGPAGSQYGGYLPQSFPSAPSPARRASRPTVEVVPEEDTYFGMKNEDSH